MKRNTCLTILFLLLSTLVAGGQTRRFDTVLLQRMAEAMQMQQCLDTIGDGTHYDLVRFQGKPVSFRVRHGYVQHIGYTLFPESLRQLIANDAVCDFLERHSLQAQLPLERIKTVEKANEEAEVVFLAGSMQLLPKCQGDSTLFFSVSNYDNKGYVVSWDREGESFCSLRFPADYYLLHGTDFSEAKETIARDLREWADTSLVALGQIDTLSLVKLSAPELFVSVGDSLFVSHLNTNSYYSEVDSASYDLLDSELFPIETLANIAVRGGVDNQIDLHLTLSMSDYGQNHVDLKLNGLLTYLREKGCVIYYGVIENTSNSLTVLLIAANKAEGYCHTIRLEGTSQVVVERKGQMEGRVSTFIPLSRIKSLFEEEH